MITLEVLGLPMQMRSAYPVSPSTLLTDGKEGAFCQVAMVVCLIMSKNEGRGKVWLQIGRNKFPLLSLYSSPEHQGFQLTKLSC